jgi:hypothetical protein
MEKTLKNFKTKFFTSLSIVLDKNFRLKP